jgi:hypothetical protein
MKYYKATKPFIIPTFTDDSTDDLFLSEMSNLIIDKGDIFALVDKPNNGDFMIIYWVESRGVRKIYDLNTALSREFISITPSGFYEITQQDFRDNEIDRIINT